MSARLMAILSVSALTLAACASTSSNPNYKTANTTYKGSTPYGASSHGGSTTTISGRTIPASSQTINGDRVVYESPRVDHTVPASTRTISNGSSTISSGTPTIVYNDDGSSTYSGSTYQSAASASWDAYDECLRRERRNEIIGAGIGGTAGAFAGKEFIGGTKGTIAGAAIGGTLGYGAGDEFTRCGHLKPAMTQATSFTTPATSTTYVYPATSTSPAQTVTISPTGQAFGNSNSVGTPGYDAVRGSLGMPVQPNPYGSTYQPYPNYGNPAYTQPQAAIPPQPTYQPPAYVPPQTTYQPPAYVQPQPVVSRPGLPAGTHEVREGDTVYSLARSRCLHVEDIRRANNLGGDFKIRLGEYINLPPSRC